MENRNIADHSCVGTSIYLTEEFDIKKPKKEVMSVVLAKKYKLC